MKRLNFGRWSWVALGILAVIAGWLLAAGCASPKASSAPAAPTSQVDTGRGKTLYAQYCAACHGQNAEGTAVASALGGRTAQQVIRQVRTPQGQMPAFSAVQISDADLDLIARFIAGLPPAGK